MAITLPIGIRVAAGAIATAVDRLGKLPQELPGIGVSLVGQAFRTSLRVRQQIAELAARGDEVLSPIIGGAEEHPAWATFDEDEDGTGDSAAHPTPRATVTNASVGDTSSVGDGSFVGDASVGVTSRRDATHQRSARRPGASEPPAAAATSDEPPASRRKRAVAAEQAAAAARTAATARKAVRARTRLTSPNPTGNGTTGTESVGSRSAGDLPHRSAPAGPPRTRTHAQDPDKAAILEQSDDGDSGAHATPSGATDLDGDHGLTIAELKDRLRDLDATAVRDLLRQEEAGPQRAAYLTLLANRLTTLLHEDT